MSQSEAVEAAQQHFDDGISLGLARLHRRRLQKQAAAAQSDDERTSLEAAVVETDRKIGALRQRMLRLERDRHDLPVNRLRAFTPLSDFEVDVLWLALAGRVEPMAAELATSIAEDKQRFWISPALCLEVLLETRRERYAALDVFADDAPLATGGLVSLVPRTGGPRGLHDMLLPAGFLAAWMQRRRTVSSEAAGFVTRVPPSLTLDFVALGAEHRANLRAAMRMVPWQEELLDPRLGEAGFDFQRGALVLITGPRGMGKTLVARALAGEAKKAALVCDAEELAGRPSDEIEAALEALFVEAGLTGEWLVLDGASRLLAERGAGEAGGSDRSAWARVRTLVHRFPVVCVVTSDNSGQIAASLRDRAFYQYELPPLGREQAVMAWAMNRPDRFVAGDDIDFRHFAQRHALSGRGIQAAVNLAMRAREGIVRAETLEAACLAQQTSGMSDVAKRTWINRKRSDLQLPTQLEKQIDEIIQTEKIRDRVLDEWGLAKRMGKGLGLVCLFDGDPGTGKTLASEVIASELGLPLFAVNVANVVSKWIGETEKNLQRIFDDAARNRCVLLFDEADALFSKRTTNVERSVDRHANMEVGLLLQLVENHRGLVLLTTNLKDSIDPAFARRFAFKLTFEFPDSAVRARVWQTLLPPTQLARDVDVEELGDEYELSGGSIRTVVLRAAYRAAVEGKRIDQRILTDCALAECKALGKLVREGR